MGNKPDKGSTAIQSKKLQNITFDGKYCHNNKIRALDSCEIDCNDPNNNYALIASIDGNGILLWILKSSKNGKNDFVEWQIGWIKMSDGSINTICISSNLQYIAIGGLQRVKIFDIKENLTDIGIIVADDESDSNKHYFGIPNVKHSNKNKNKNKNDLLWKIKPKTYQFGDTSYFQIKYLNNYDHSMYSDNYLFIASYKRILLWNQTDNKIIKEWILNPLNIESFDYKIDIDNKNMNMNRKCINGKIIVCAHLNGTKLDILNGPRQSIINSNIFVYSFTIDTKMKQNDKEQKEEKINDLVNTKMTNNNNSSNHNNNNNNIDDNIAIDDTTARKLSKTVSNDFLFHLECKHKSLCDISFPSHYNDDFFTVYENLGTMLIFAKIEDCNAYNLGDWEEVAMQIKKRNEARIETKGKNKRELNDDSTTDEEEQQGVLLHDVHAFDDDVTADPEVENNDDEKKSDEKEIKWDYENGWINSCLLKLSEKSLSQDLFLSRIFGNFPEFSAKLQAHGVKSNLSYFVRIRTDVSVNDPGAANGANGVNVDVNSDINIDVNSTDSKYKKFGYVLAGMRNYGHFLGHDYKNNIIKLCWINENTIVIVWIDGIDTIQVFNAKYNHQRIELLKHICNNILLAPQSGNTRANKKNKNKDNNNNNNNSNVATRMFIDNNIVHEILCYVGIEIISLNRPQMNWRTMHSDLFEHAFASVNNNSNSNSNVSEDNKDGSNYSNRLNEFDSTLVVLVKDHIKLNRDEIEQAHQEEKEKEKEKLNLNKNSINRELMNQDKENLNTNANLHKKQGVSKLNVEINDKMITRDLFFQLKSSLFANTDSVCCFQFDKDKMNYRSPKSFDAKKSIQSIKNTAVLMNEQISRPAFVIYETFHDQSVSNKSQSFVNASVFY